MSVTTEPTRRRRWLTGGRGSATFLCLLYLLHARSVWQHATDIPFEDEWTLLASGLGDDLDVRWLWQPHNEHRLVPTKLLMCALYHLNGWNVRTNHVINFALYTGIVALMIVIIRRALGGRPAWLPWIAAAFLLQAPVATNILWGMQSSMHLSILFALLAALSLFREGTSLSRLTLGSAFSLAAAYSFGTGVAVSGALCVSARDAWFIESTYRELGTRLATGAACVQRFDPAMRNRSCPELYPGGVPSDYMRRAQALGLSFTRHSPRGSAP